MTQVRKARNFARQRRWLTAAIFALAIGLVVAMAAAAATSHTGKAAVPSAANSLLRATATVDSCGYPVSGGAACRGTRATAEPSPPPAFRPPAGGVLTAATAMKALYTEQH